LAAAAAALVAAAEPNTASFTFSFSSSTCRSSACWLGNIEGCLNFNLYFVIIYKNIILKILYLKLLII